MMYGRTHHRLRNGGNMSDHSNCNGSCWGYTALALCGFQWALQMVQRNEMRSTYNLEGGGCKDCLCACCCTPCDLMQQDKEAAYREQEKQGLLGAPSGYTSPASMTYPSPGSEKKSPGMGGMDAVVAGSSAPPQQMSAPAPVHSTPPGYQQPQQPQQYHQQQYPQQDHYGNQAPQQQYYQQQPQQQPYPYQ